MLLGGFYLHAGLIVIVQKFPPDKVENPIHYFIISGYYELI